MTKCYLYSVLPIDLGWSFASPLNELPKREPWESAACAEIYAFAAVALHVARERAHWEGDFREGCEPHIVMLPQHSGSIEYAVFWKQENNGDSFVASTVPLPWLAEDDPAIEFHFPGDLDWEGMFFGRPVPMQAGDNVTPLAPARTR